MQVLPKERLCFGATATCSDAFSMTVLMDNKGWLELILRAHDLLRIANSLCIPAAPVGNEQQFGAPAAVKRFDECLAGRPRWGVPRAYSDASPRT